MSFYVAADHPEYTWNQCMNESKRMTAGHKGELFVLDLSFIGWFFVGSLCFGIGTLWVMPYYNASWANYYDALNTNATVLLSCRNGRVVAEGRPGSKEAKF